MDSNIQTTKSNAFAKTLSHDKLITIMWEAYNLFVHISLGQNLNTGSKDLSPQRKLDPLAVEDRVLVAF